MSDTALTVFDAAMHALAECRTVVDTKEVMSRASALETYYRQKDDCEHLVVRAIEIRTIAERKLGEILATTPKAKAGRPPKSEIGTREGPISEATTLKEKGLSKNEAARAQKLYAMPEDEFLARVEATKAEGNPSSRAVLRLEAPQRETVAHPDRLQPTQESAPEGTISEGMMIAGSVKAQITTIQKADIEHDDALLRIMDFCRYRIAEHERGGQRGEMPEGLTAEKLAEDIVEALVTIPLGMEGLPRSLARIANFCTDRGAAIEKAEAEAKEARRAKRKGKKQ